MLMHTMWTVHGPVPPKVMYAHRYWAEGGLYTPYDPLASERCGSLISHCTPSSCKHYANRRMPILYCHNTQTSAKFR